MADATVTKFMDIHIPNIEVVQLTASTGETYSSRKFGTIVGAVACYNEATGVTATNLVASWSGRVATITSTGLTDKLVTLVLFGNPGN